MGILGKFKKTSPKVEAKPEVKSEVKDASKSESAKASPAKQSQAVAKKSEPTTEQAKETKKTVLGLTDRAGKILVQPLVTEKSAQMSSLNKYVFEVATNTNKIEIAKAVRAVYGVDPLNVRVANIARRRVRFGRSQGMKKARKKAIVTLKKGDKIEVYEGV
ncbi:50S ribosomal protein L23 [bacterium]|nr:50S ribosomal protein L23 [bacterium]|tara:strand:+ start:260 stop:742 length:483 start_codon:yes stop_codon:yes gene_type:complete